MKWVDTHCHVHFNAYKEDMHEVVKRQLDEDVFMITVGTQETTSQNGIALANQYEGVWCSIGLHPNHVHAQSFHDVNELPQEHTSEAKREVIKTRSEHFDERVYAELVAHPKVVAIGECGLDYYRIPEGKDPDVVRREQWEQCEAQLRFASKYDKPVIIHCRDAHEDQAKLIQMLVDDGLLARRGVIHSFTGTLDEAKRYIDLGFYLGINGILYFSKELQSVVAQISLKHLLLETDAPYLTPPPDRGKRNEPKYIKRVAELMATLQGTTPERVRDATTNNAIQLFSINL